MSLVIMHKQAPVGGRLALFSHNWERLTKDPWVLTTVKGYRLPLHHWPSLRQVQVQFSLDSVRAEALRSEISGLVAKGAVVHVRKNLVHLVNPLFVVPKSGGGWRPIIDLRHLNQFLSPPHFKMEGLYMVPSIVQRDSFLVKIDLKDAYLTVPVAEDFQSLLAFQDNQGEFLQFQTLPFGLSTAPYTFTKLTKPAIRFLRQVGIQIIVYLDDMLLVAQSEGQLCQDLSTTLWLLTALGFIVNLTKSVLTPAKQLEFLGFLIDTQSMTIVLPPAKVTDLQREAAKLLELRTVSTKSLARLVGKLVATKPAVFIAPLRYRALQSQKISSTFAQQEQTLLSQEACSELRWWSTQLPAHCSAPLLKPEASLVITSDASTQGWGAECQGVKTGGKWTVNETQCHINILELKAAFLAIQSFLKEREAVNILVRLDNRVAIAYLNKMGSTSLTPLCQLAIQVWDWCLVRHITLRAEYLPGVQNTTADWESRHHQDSSDWQLCPSVFDTLNYQLGPFSIDLFASRTNHQLPTYCSWRPDPGASTIDAFSISWTKMTPYLFPPFCLVGRALSKIRRESVNFACLIAPAWPAQHWYPQLLSMLSDFPILLPEDHDLLLDVNHQPNPLQEEGRLYLTAWPISGRPMRHKAFHRELLDLSSNLGGETPIPLTTQPGVSGTAGALDGVSIPFQHL